MPGKEKVQDRETARLPACKSEITAQEGCSLGPGRPGWNIDFSNNSGISEGRVC
jgi:hypothetical protein